MLTAECCCWRDLGKINYFTEAEMHELLELKKKWGFPDARLDKELQNCDIRANDTIRDSSKAAGVERRAFKAPRRRTPPCQHRHRKTTPPIKRRL